MPRLHCQDNRGYDVGVSVFVATCNVSDFSVFCDNSSHVSEVSFENFLEFLRKYYSVLEYKTSKKLVHRRLIICSKLKSFYSGAYLLRSEFGESAADACRVYQSGRILVLRMKLPQDFQLAFVAGLVHYYHVVYEKLVSRLRERYESRPVRGRSHVYSKIFRCGFEFRRPVK